jgi:hypothetical protein
MTFPAFDTTGGASTERSLAAQPLANAEDSLEIVVLHTTTKGTLQSLKTAAGLAAGLGAHIRLLVLEVVPYPLPVEAPQVPLDFTQRRFRTVADGARIETTVDIRLGRDCSEMLESALKPRSLIVFTGRRRWFLSPERRIAKRLEQRGHQVVLSSFPAGA